MKTETDADAFFFKNIDELPPSLLRDQTLAAMAAESKLSGKMAVAAQIWQPVLHSHCVKLHLLLAEEACKLDGLSPILSRTIINSPIGWPFWATSYFNIQLYVGCTLTERAFAVGIVPPLADATGGTEDQSETIAELIAFANTLYKKLKEPDQIWHAFEPGEWMIFAILLRIYEEHLLLRLVDDIKKEMDGQFC